MEYFYSLIYKLQSAGADISSLTLANFYSILVSAIVIWLGAFIAKIVFNGIANKLNAQPKIALFFTLLGRFVFKWAWLMIAFVVLNTIGGTSSIIGYAKILVQLLFFLSMGKFFATYISAIFTGKEAAVASDEGKTYSFIAAIIKFIIYAIIIILFLDQLGVSITPLLAALGIAGFAIGYAMQDTVSNLVSGIQVSLIKELKPGSFVSQGPAEGILEQVTWRHTVLKTANAQRVLIPNKLFSSAITTSISGPKDQIGFAVPFTVNTENDVEKVKSVALNALNQALGKTEGGNAGSAKITLDSFAAAGINFTASAKVANLWQKGAAVEAFQQALIHEFKANGVKL